MVTNKENCNRNARLVFVGAVTAAAFAAAAYWLYSSSLSSPTLDKKEKTDKDVKEEKKEANNSSTTDNNKELDAAGKLQADRRALMSLLEAIGKNQEEITKMMDNVIDQVDSKNLGTLEVYEIVANNLSADPLEEQGMTLRDFDKVIDKFHDDEEVCSMILGILDPAKKNFGGAKGAKKSSSTSPPDLPSNDAAANAEVMDVDRLIKINLAMQNKMEQIVDELEKLEGTAVPRLSGRYASVAAQIFLGAFLKREFGIQGQALEKAVEVHSDELNKSPEFFHANSMIQAAMSRLMSRLP